MNSFLLQFLLLSVVLAAVWCTPTLHEGVAEERSVPEDDQGSADCVDSAGVTHKHDTNFPSTDGCNSCFCYNGIMGCTRKACLDIAKAPTQ